MAEVLTESFCERCGTRYTFESAQPRVKRLKGVKVLSRGLKNFVLSDDSSLDEAMAAARSDTDREITAQQLDAFHQTFNFCMTCRQYTCANCWNEGEGTCLTCSPHLGREILPAPFPDLDPTTGLAIVHAADTASGNGASNGNGAATGSLDLGAWPVSDFASPGADASGADASGADTFASDPAGDFEAVDVAARLAALTALDPGDPPAEAVAETEPADIDPVQAVQSIDDAVALSAEPAPAQTATPAASTEEVAAAAAAQTAALLHRFRPGQNLDAEIEAYEREQAALESQTADGIEPVVAAAALRAADAPVAEAQVAEAEVAEAEVAEEEAVEVQPAEAEALTSEPAVAETEVAAETDEDVLAAAAAAAALAAAATRTDIVEQPTWQIVAPDIDPTPVVAPLTPPATPAQAGNGAPPEWPAQPEWPTQARATAGLPFLGRPAQPTGGLESLWAESNREVVSAPLAPGRPGQGGVQPCLSCGLSLSATARFCRRCGTSQVA